MGYKRDLRSTLDFSQIRSEDYLKKEAEKYTKQNIIMRYRIYGHSGVTDRERKKLEEWEVCKPTGKMQKVRVKRKVRKVQHMYDKEISFYVDDSRSCDSAYTNKFEPILQSNEDGDPMLVNQGFTVMPLCPTIYGKQAARESANRHFQKSMIMQEKV
jgi:hypothetical protein